jgi:hypothetical protein
VGGWEKFQKRKKKTEWGGEEKIKFQEKKTKIKGKQIGKGARRK